MNKLMGKYRIVKYTKGSDTVYEVQKRSWFGFWYNFNNIDGCTTGVYESEHEARYAINKHREKHTTEIVEVKDE